MVLEKEKSDDCKLKDKKKSLLRVIHIFNVNNPELMCESFKEEILLVSDRKICRDMSSVGICHTKGKLLNINVHNEDRFYCHQTPEMAYYSDDMPTNYTSDWLEFNVYGEIKTTGRYENGEQVGEWTDYYLNRNKEQQGSYVGGYKTETWFKWLKNGNLLRRTEFKHGEKNGYDILMGSKGNISEAWNYVLGKLDGICTSYYDELPPSIDEKDRHSTVLHVGSDGAKKLVVLVTKPGKEIYYSVTELPSDTSTHDFSKESVKTSDFDKSNKAVYVPLEL